MSMWKSRFQDLADAVRAERDARRTGQGVRDAADRVTELLDPSDPDAPSTEGDDTDSPA